MNSYWPPAKGLALGRPAEPAIVGPAGMQSRFRAHASKWWIELHGCHPVWEPIRILAQTVPGWTWSVARGLLSAPTAALVSAGPETCLALELGRGLVRPWRSVWLGRGVDCVILNDMAANITRRRALEFSALAGAATSCERPAGTGGASSADVYRRVGVEPVINGVGTVTILGGSIMPPEVVDAMLQASKHFVPLRELQVKAGDRIAQLIGVPAAMISCGAASAITCGTAAAVTAGDDEKLARLPDTAGMKNEIIQQKAHRTGYEAQMELVGAKTVWVETRKELERAFNDRTAMMFFLNKADRLGQLKRAEWVEVAKAHGVPTMNDAAADVPPPNRLRDYVEEGFDMVIFSGGKGLLGPQASGLLLGRPDLIEAARKAISPNGGIGRGMKVGKEEIMGLVAAVERYLNVDHAAERRELDGRAERVMQALQEVSGVFCATHVPDIANHVPHVLVDWSEEGLGLSSESAVERLLAGSPPVAVSRLGVGQLRISMWMLRPGEDLIVAERLRALFS